MEMDAAGGSRLEFAPFDLNGDGRFTEEDFVGNAVDIDGDGIPDPVPPSGKKSAVGILPQPGILSDKDKEFKYGNGSTGEIEVTTENPGPGDVGRRSWRELYLQ